jgi:hypothetical protein
MGAKLLFGLVVSILVGIVLVWLGIRGRRINLHPVCRSCRFDLEGVLPAGITCPECGAGLKRERAVRIGQRKRRPVFILVGAAMTAIPVALIGTVVFAMITGTDLNAHKPLGVLLLETRFASDKVAAAAGEEAHRRYQRRTLNESQLAKLVDTAFALQADPSRPWSPVWGDIVHAEHVAGAVSDERLARFQVRAAQLEWRVRPEVGRGATVPIAIGVTGARMGSSGSYVVLGYIGEARIDGGRVKFSGVTDREPALNGLALYVPLYDQLATRNGGFLFHVQLHPTEPLAPGRHDLEMDLVLYATGWDKRGELPGWTSGVPDLSRPEFRELKFKSSFIVREDSGPGVALIDPDERMVREFEAALADCSVSRGRDGGLSLWLRNWPPGPFAFDILVRAGTEEFPAGAITSPPPGDSRVVEAGPIDVSFSPQQAGRTVDVVLRPSPAAAAATAHLTQIYGREIIIENVEIQRGFEWPGLFDSGATGASSSGGG